LGKGSCNAFGAAKKGSLRLKQQNNNRANGQADVDVFQMFSSTNVRSKGHC
jgi:hypothetical protein